MFAACYQLLTQDIAIYGSLFYSDHFQDFNRVVQLYVCIYYKYDRFLILYYVIYLFIDEVLAFYGISSVKIDLFGLI